MLPGVDLNRIDNELLDSESLQVSSVSSERYDYADIERIFKVLDPDEQVKIWQKEIDAAKKKNELQTAIDICRNIEGLSAAKESDRKKAFGEREKLEQQLEDEAWKAKQGGGGKSRTGQTQQVALKGPRRSDLQLVWAHDAGTSSIHGGRTYQYRTRMRIYNNYLGNPGFLKNPEDATKSFIVGDWSDPSDPITVPPSAEFYVSKADKDRRSARLNIYQWAFGVWVDNSFEVTPGERIAGQAYKAVPDDPKRMVLFDTHALALDIDFGRVVYEERSAGRSDFETRPTETAALVYLDDRGLVQERFVSLDRNSPDQKAIKDRLFDEKAAKQKSDQASEKEKDQAGKGKGQQPPKKSKGSGGRRG